MPLLLAPEGIVSPHELTPFTSPRVAEWERLHPAPPAPYASLLRNLAHLPLARHLYAYWRMFIREESLDLREGWRYGYWGSALRSLLVVATFPLWCVPFFVVVGLWRRYAPLVWRARLHNLQFRIRLYDANRRLWLRQRPTRAEVRYWHGLQCGHLLQLEAAEAAEAATEEARQRDAFADYVLRAVFGAEPLGPDEIIGDHLTN